MMKTKEDLFDNQIFQEYLFNPLTNPVKSEVRTFLSGECITEDDELYIIINGKIAEQQNSKDIRYYEQGDFVGMDRLVYYKPDPKVCIADGDTTVHVIKKIDVMHKLESETVGIQLAIKILGQHIHLLQNKLTKD